MVAVEYLVVSKDAEFLVVVSKSFVQGLFYRLEKHTTFFSENVAKTVQLLGTVCKNTEPIAISQILLKRLLQQVEILMELRLRRYMEGYRCVRQSRGTMAYLNTSESDHIARKALSAY